MRFFTASAALVAFATSAFAQTADFNPVYTPLDNENIPAGSSYEVTWDAPEKYAGETISISLIGGATQGTQIPIGDIATGIANSAEKYTWNVDATLGADAVYGLVVKLESNPEVFQYSNPFHITPAQEGGDDYSSAPVEAPGSSTVYLTQTHGTKTVTLTSCPPTTTSVPETTSTPVVIPTYVAPPPANTTTTYASSTLYTTTKVANTTVIPQPPSTPVVTPPTVVVPQPTQPEAPPVDLPTVVPSVVPTAVPASAGRFIAGPVAIFGGLAVAMLML